MSPGEQWDRTAGQWSTGPGHWGEREGPHWRPFARPSWTFLIKHSSCQLFLLRLEFSHQSQVASVLPCGPSGSYCQQVGCSIWHPRGPPEALPSVCAHLSGCTGLGHVEPWDQRRVFSCHPSLSLCLPIHLSTPRLMREQWEWQPQAGPSIRKAQSEGRSVRER